MASGIDYKVYMNRALRRVMADALSQIAEDGLPGEHHLLISFETDHPGVDIPDWLSEKYPEEMQIVLQHWFDDLAVMDDRFSVVLNFSETPQTLVVPFAAVRSFVDPSVEFGLRFDPEEAPPPDAPQDPPDEPVPPSDTPGDVVQLDRFRKH